MEGLGLTLDVSLAQRSCGVTSRAFRGNALAKLAIPLCRGSSEFRWTLLDHDRRERCRTFPSARHARAWMDDYITAERRGRESLRRFLLDLDARETSAMEARTIGQLLQLYLKVNAHPSNPGGLAPSTYERYESLVERQPHGSRRSTLSAMIWKSLML
jgi:hypothetical protein